MNNLFKLAENEEKARMDHTNAKEEFSSHPRVKEWIDFILGTKHSLEDIYYNDNTIEMQYYFSGCGVEWTSITLDVLTTDEPIKEYYERIVKEKEQAEKERVENLEIEQMNKKIEKSKELYHKSKEELIEMINKGLLK